MFPYRRQRRRIKRSRRRLKNRLTTLLGLIYCRRLAEMLGRSITGRTAACHVGTRRRRAFYLFILIYVTVINRSYESFKLQQLKNILHLIQQYKFDNIVKPCPLPVYTVSQKTTLVLHTIDSTHINRFR